MARLKDTQAYLLPYHHTRDMGRFSDGSESVTFTREEFESLIKVFLRAVEVDEDWYRSEYDDVDAAIVAGSFRSARHHFIQNGYREGRRPAPVVVDENWYGKIYSDVTRSLEFGEIESYQEHFDKYGESEGRFPFQLA
ncbi:hypothetical protein FIU28_16825 [Tardiphaga sp. vice154]|uniref:hypothetical protein n=1 Tax=Tardiphaga sp. vice154 TaxID=2592814 RepID=UPI001163B5E2|nr:hypothetical protein [Tardiphaga sp. vice154]QDM22631.1 hypothetical protein FIU28_16825 [Tardiphaga sp. vice154]